MSDFEMFIDSHDDLYVIRDQRTRCVKIGRGQSPVGRMATFQTGCPGDLELVSTATGAGWLEPLIHRLFLGHVIKGRREWYEADSPADRLAGRLCDEEYSGGVVFALSHVLFRMAAEDLAAVPGGLQDVATIYKERGELYCKTAALIEKNLAEAAASAEVANG